MGSMPKSMSGTVNPGIIDEQEFGEGTLEVFNEEKK